MTYNLAHSDSQPKSVDKLLKNRECICSHKDAAGGGEVVVRLSLFIVGKSSARQEGASADRKGPKTRFVARGFKQNQYWQRNANLTAPSAPNTQLRFRVLVGPGNV